MLEKERNEKMRCCCERDECWDILWANKKRVLVLAFSAYDAITNKFIHEFQELANLNPCPLNILLHKYYVTGSIPWYCCYFPFFQNYY